MFNNRRDLDYFWEQAVLNKRQKLDPGESYANRRGKFEARTFDLPLDHRRDLTVGEIWKEKKNIVVVGDAEASFILYCARIPGTCNIFNTRTMSLVLLEPGKRKVSTDPIQGFMSFTAYTAGSAKHFHAAACDASSFLHVFCLYMVHLNPDKI